MFRKDVYFMGLGCSCGVLIPTPITPVGTVEFEFEDNTTAEGTATYTANVCADRPQLGSVTVNFIDTETNRSFTFTSTNISNVNCETLDGTCAVTIGGFGMVTGENILRQFRITFVDRVAPNLDSVNSFVIIGFGSATQDESFAQEITTFCSS